jgi:hypothetical protein
MIDNGEVAERPKRIGILISDLGKLNLRALKYLVLSMNSLQQAFQYEFLDCDPKDKLIRLLSSLPKVNRQEVKKEATKFIDRLSAELRKQISGS